MPKIAYRNQMALMLVIPTPGDESEHTNGNNNGLTPLFQDRASHIGTRQNIKPPSIAGGVAW